jgi:hypothetical protein
MICSGIFNFKSVYCSTLILLLGPTTALAQVSASPQSTSPPSNVSVSPEGPPGEYYLGPDLPGAEVFIFIGAGQACRGGRQGGGGIPSQGPTSCTPTGSVQGYIESENMDLADVVGVTAKGTLSVNGATVGQALLTTDTDAAVSTVSVSPTNGTTYSFNGEAMSCYFVSVPVGTIPPPELPPCFFGCGAPGPEAVSGSQISVQPAFTVGLPFSNAGSCIKFNFNNPVSVTYGLPLITAISQPASANIGTSNNSLTVTGSNLAGDAGISSATFASAGGTTFSGSVPSPNDNRETVNFSVPSFAPLGNYQFTISNEWGTSNAVNFTVGGPPASIASLTPPVWQAGSTFPLRVLGSGFGNVSGGLAISGAGVTFTTPATVNATGTEIDTTVTVDAASPIGNAAEVTVTPAYAGGNFTCGTCNGGSAVAMATAPINAIAAPAPVIILGSDSSQCAAAPNKANAQLTPNVGQRIAFVGCVPTLTGDLAVISESWSPTSPNAGTSIANFTVSSAPQLQETISQVTATSCQIGLPCAYNPFYFVTVGSTATFTFSYTLNNGQTGSAPVTFTSNGPQGVTVSVRPGAAVQQYLFSGKDVIGLGNANQDATSGVFFKPSVSSSATVPGQYSWVQIITKDEEGVVDPDLGKDILPSDPDLIPGLDTSYPYSNDQGEIGDAPYLVLVSKEGEISQSFAATMYLMWTPQADASCQTGGACTIPVPLVSAAWGFHDDTVNTLNPSMPSTYHNWLQNACSALDSGTVITPLSKSSDYPMWGKVAN